MSNNIEGKVAVINGASSGPGEAPARPLSEQGGYAGQFAPSWQPPYEKSSIRGPGCLFLPKRSLISFIRRIPFSFCLLILCANLVMPRGGQAAEKAYTNSIGMEFVLIPAGTFLMGSSENDREAAANENPRHQVSISKPFYLGKYEVTQAQWEAVMGSNPYTLSRTNPYYSLPGMADRLRKPTNPATVAWNDAQEFIKRLNQKEGHPRYRLPTEAEWEYAARAGMTTAYSFGDDARQLGRYAWHGEDFESGSTHPVGQKEPNAWGLYDVHGNVWEWVQDWYDERYYANSPSVDPKGPPSGSGRVVRGGSWHKTATSWRSAFRRQYEPDYRGISIGFRLALSMDR